MELSQPKTPEKDCQRGKLLSHDRDRERRMPYDSNFSFFREIFSKFIPSSIWKLPLTPDEINLCKFIAKLCVQKCIAIIIKICISVSCVTAHSGMSFVTAHVRVQLLSIFKIDGETLLKIPLTSHLLQS